MAKLTIEDIMILIMIAAVVGIGLWMLAGSPTEMQAIISIAMFFGTAGLFILKKTYSIDKNSAIGFIKVKHDIEKVRIEMNNEFNNINNKLDKLIKR